MAEGLVNIQVINYSAGAALPCVFRSGRVFTPIVHSSVQGGDTAIDGYVDTIRINERAPIEFALNIILYFGVALVTLRTSGGRLIVKVRLSNNMCRRDY